MIGCWHHQSRVSLHYLNPSRVLVRLARLGIHPAQHHTIHSLKYVYPSREKTLSRGCAHETSSTAPTANEDVNLPNHRAAGEWARKKKTDEYVYIYARDYGACVLHTIRWRLLIHSWIVARQGGCPPVGRSPWRDSGWKTSGIGTSIRAQLPQYIIYKCVYIIPTDV